MALNPKTIKALFGKLAPMADDVAGAVANYGDDAARLIGEYGDDAARLVSNYGDDALRAADRISDAIPASQIAGRPYKWSLDTTGKVTQIFDDAPNEVFINDKLFHRPDIGELMDDNRWGDVHNAATKQRLLDKRLKPYVASSKETAIGDKLSNLYDEWYSGNNPVKGAVPDDIIGTPYSDRFGNSITLLNDEYTDVFGMQNYPVFKKQDLETQLIGDYNRRANTHSWAMRKDGDYEFPVPVTNEFDSLTPPTDLEQFFDNFTSIKKHNFSGYSPLLEGTVDYPDGFATPESFARYYDALERGYALPTDTITSSEDTLAVLKALKDKADAGVIPGSRYLDLEYDPEVYRSILSDTEGPLQDFFAKKSKLNRFSTTPTATPTEVFSNPMFEEDWWL